MDSIGDQHGNGGLIGVVDKDMRGGQGRPSSCMETDASKQELRQSFCRTRAQRVIDQRSYVC